MATPAREQIEAYLATLPPDQQGPALDEIRRRMEAESAISPEVAAEPPSAWERGIAAEKKRFGEFSEGFGEKAPEALRAAIKPMTYARAVGGAVQFASQ